MNTIAKGTQWSGNDHQAVSTDVNLEASQHVGVWLVDGSIADGDGHPFRMTLGVRTPEDAARAYARHRKENGHTPPAAFRVFPLAGLEPIAKSGVLNEDGDEDWSAFSDAWVEVRL